MRKKRKEKTLINMTLSRTIPCLKMATKKQKKTI